MDTSNSVRASPHATQCVGGLVAEFLVRRGMSAFVLRAPPVTSELARTEEPSEAHPTTGFPGALAFSFTFSSFSSPVLRFLRVETRFEKDRRDLTTQVLVAPLKKWVRNASDILFVGDGCRHVILYGRELRID